MSASASDPVRASLERLLGSRTFATSERLRRFLRFAIESSLAGQGSRLKEYTLGVEVFDRDSGYDPRIDPIVRVEARRLRAKLKSYYAGEGAADPVIFSFPEGSYVPVAAPREAPEPAAADVPSIAVLPFANFSPEPRQDYFCDGMTEEIINALTKVEGLRVVARTSVFQFKGRPEDIREIAARLNARYVLEGSVRKAGSNVRITAQLIDARDGYHLSSETYDRKLKDVFALQDEIAWAIVDALKVRLAPSARLVPHYEADPDAYAVYLKARHYWNRQTISGLRKAVSLFKQVLATHPRYAPAWCGLADSHCMLAYFGAASPVRVVSQVEAAVAKALEIDESLAEAHATLGAVKAFYEWSWGEALVELGRAIELTPGFARARQWRGVVLMVRGSTEEGAAEIQSALQIDPLSLNIAATAGLGLYAARRFREAVEHYQRITELAPTFEVAWYELGLAYAALGQHQEAIRAQERAYRLSHNAIYLGAYGEALAGAGHAVQARSVLRRLNRLATQGYVPPLAFAFVHLGLGQHDQAFLWLDRAVEERSSLLAWLRAELRYDPLRHDPRFQQLLRRVNLTG